MFWQAIKRALVRVDGQLPLALRCLLTHSTTRTLVRALTPDIPGALSQPPHPEHVIDCLCRRRAGGSAVQRGGGALCGAGLCGARRPRRPLRRRHGQQGARPLAVSEILLRECAAREVVPRCCAALTLLPCAGIRFHLVFICDGAKLAAHTGERCDKQTDSDQRPHASMSADAPPARVVACGTQAAIVASCTLQCHCAGRARHLHAERATITRQQEYGALSFSACSSARCNGTATAHFDACNGCWLISGHNA